jgi:integrase
VQYCGPQGRGTSVERYHLSIPRYSTGFAVDLRRERHRLSRRRALGLKWGDVDWLGGQIAIQRSVVAQVVDAPKTQGSGKSISVATELLQRLQAWKQITEFASDADWVFASPVKLGRLPYSYTGVVRIFRRAAAQVRDWQDCDSHIPPQFPFMDGSRRNPAGGSAATDEAYHHRNDSQLRLHTRPDAKSSQNKDFRADFC